MAVNYFTTVYFTFAVGILHVPDGFSVKELRGAIYSGCGGMVEQQGERGVPSKGLKCQPSATYKGNINDFPTEKNLQAIRIIFRNSAKRNPTTRDAPQDLNH